MASVSDPFIAHCIELLRPLGVVRGRRMFSGYGIYADDIFVAIAVREALYLKVDETTRAAFEAGGGHPFTYEQGGKAGRLNFWTVPDEAMESPSLMLPWARQAFAAGLRARAAKPAPKTAAQTVTKKAAKKVAGKVAKKAAKKVAKEAATKVAKKAAKKAASKARRAA